MCHTALCYLVTQMSSKHLVCNQIQISFNRIEWHITTYRTKIYSHEITNRFYIPRLHQMVLFLRLLSLNTYKSSKSHTTPALKNPPPFTIVIKYETHFVYTSNDVRMSIHLTRCHFIINPGSSEGEIAKIQFHLPKHKVNRSLLVQVFFLICAAVIPLYLD